MKAVVFVIAAAVTLAACSTSSSTPPPSTGTHTPTDPTECPRADGKACL